MRTTARPRSVETSAKIIRADGTVEDLGVIAYWHRSWWRRLAWRLRQARKTASG